MSNCRLSIQSLHKVEICFTDDFTSVDSAVCLGGIGLRLRCDCISAYLLGFRKGTPQAGPGRSVIAAAWFNKLAGEKQLPYWAVARGVTPQDELSKPTVDGLKKDGLAFLNEKPRGLSRQEANEGVRVVSFFPLPTSLKPAAFDQFEVPGPGDGYDQSRDAVLVHVRKLIEDLQTSHAR